MTTTEQRYIYRGDRLTDASYKDRVCTWVTRINLKGKRICVRGRNGNALVQFVDNEQTCVVLARQLRKMEVAL